MSDEVRRILIGVVAYNPGPPIFKGSNRFYSRERAGRALSIINSRQFQHGDTENAEKNKERFSLQTAKRSVNESESPAGQPGQVGGSYRMLVLIDRYHV